MNAENIVFREIGREELGLGLFASFDRRQEVNLCLRKTERGWEEISDPFMDDWSEADYAFLVECLRGTLDGGGFVYGAFVCGALKGFVSVEGVRSGSRGQYMDLSSIHVSRECRGGGIGKRLFAAAKAFAGEKGAEKLYISAHSAVESQAFYRAAGCREAEEYDPRHVEKEPFDCQLECAL